MAKKEKAKKPEEPEAEKPEAEGEEGAPAKKKMSGKTLILFIVLPAILVIGGGGAAAVMLLGGHPAAAAEHAGADGEKKAEKKKPEKKDEHGGEHGGDKKEGGAPAAGAEGDVGHALDCEGEGPCYYQLPKLVVNLAGVEGERTPYMELELVLEAASTDTFDSVPDDMPRLKDQLNSYLRELRVEDLNGSEGSYRLRRELLKRFNTVIAPAKVDAVLIQGMLIQ